jgi:hypothetical protein
VGRKFKKWETVEHRCPSCSTVIPDAEQFCGNCTPRIKFPPCLTCGKDRDRQERALCRTCRLSLQPLVLSVKEELALTDLSRGTPSRRVARKLRMSEQRVARLRRTVRKQVRRG